MTRRSTQKTKTEKPVKKRSFLFRFIAVVFSLGFLGMGIGVGGVLWAFWEYGRDLPDYRQLAKYDPPVMTRVHAGNGALLAEYATEKRVFVPVTEMPEPLIAAFLSAEDKDFFNHPGVDVKALSRAVVTNIIIMIGAARLGHPRSPSRWPKTSF